MTDTVEVRPDQVEVRPGEIEVHPDQVQVTAFDAANNRIQVPEAGDIPTYMAQPASTRFGHSLWNATIGGAWEGLKTALGTRELDTIADLVKQGQHKAALALLGQYMTQGPAGRLSQKTVDNSVDQFQRGVNDVVKGDWGGALTHAVGQVPIVGPMVSQPIEQLRNKDYAGAAGTVVGEGLMLGGPEVLSRVASIPLMPRLGVRNTLNPVDQASQAFLDAHGIETPLSMQTGSRTARNLEGSVRHEIGGSGYAEEARAQTRADVSQLADQLANQAAPGPPVSRTDAGGAVLGRMKTDIRTLDLQADQAYKNAYQVENDPANLQSVPKEVETAQGWQTVRDPNGNPVYEDMPLPVDMFDIQVALKPIAERYARTLSDTDARASLGLKTMREIINGPRHKPLSQAETDLGLLKQAANSERGLRELRTESQGLAANTVGLLQRKINSTMAGAQGGQQGLAELQAGRRATAQKWGIADTAKKFGSPNIEEIEPAAVFNKLVGGQDIRASFLRRVEALAPAEMKQVGRAYLEELLNRVRREGDIGHVTEALNKWDALGKDAKRVLFRNPQMVSDLDNLFVSFKRLAAEPNPSGSGYIVALNRFKQTLTSALGAAVGAHGSGTEGAAIGLMGAQGLYVLENAALARLLYNPRFTRLLSRGIQAQVSGRQAAAGGIAAELIKLAGTDAEAEPKTQRPHISTFDK